MHETSQLLGTKSFLKSQSIQGNILAILATLGSVASIVVGGAPLEIIVPAASAAAAAIWGNIMSVFGRFRATKQIS